jgi:hypothetical protein
MIRCGGGVRESTGELRWRARLRGRRGLDSGEVRRDMRQLRAVEAPRVPRGCA